MPTKWGRSVTRRDRWLTGQSGVPGKGHGVDRYVTARNRACRSASDSSTDTGLLMSDNRLMGCKLWVTRWVKSTDGVEDLKDGGIEDKDHSVIRSTVQAALCRGGVPEKWGTGLGRETRRRAVDHGSIRAARERGTGCGWCAQAVGTVRGPRGVDAVRRARTRSPVTSSPATREAMTEEEDKVKMRDSGSGEPV